MQHSHCPQLQTPAMPTPSQSLELQTGGSAPGRQLNLASLPLWKESDKSERTQSVFRKMILSQYNCLYFENLYLVIDQRFAEMCALLPWQSICKILDPHKRVLTGFISIPYLGRGWYPSFLALELRPLLLWCTAALRVQPCTGGRRFSTSGHHRACLCCRTGVLGSRRG